MTDAGVQDNNSQLESNISRDKSGNRIPTPLEQLLVPLPHDDIVDYAFGSPLATLRHIDSIFLREPIISLGIIACIVGSLKIFNDQMLDIVSFFAKGNADQSSQLEEGQQCDEQLSQQNMDQDFASEEYSQQSRGSEYYESMAAEHSLSPGSGLNWHQQMHNNYNEYISNIKEAEHSRSVQQEAFDRFLHKYERA